MRRFVMSHALDLGLVFVVLIWGFSPIVFKIALNEVQPLTFVIMRFFLLSIVAVVILLVRARVDKAIRPFRVRRADLGWLVLSALAGYGIYQLLYIEGLARTTPFASSLLLATVPLWSAVLVAILGLERISPAQWIGIVISLAGIAWFMLAGGSHTSDLPADHALSAGDIILGGALSLGAAILFALYGVVNKRLVKRYTPTELMCYTLLIGTLALAPFGFAAIAQQDWSHVTWRLWVILPFSVVFPIYITYSIWNWAIGIRGVGYVTIYNYAVPIVAAIVAWKAFGEALNGTQLVSAGVTLAGMLLARWAITRSQRGRARVAAPPAPANQPALAREVTD